MSRRGNTRNRPNTKSFGSKIVERINFFDLDILLYMRIHIHIGCYKTGTTAIQSHLSRNRDALESCGWLYPLAGSQNGHAHHLIPFALQKPQSDGGKGDVESILESIVDEASTRNKDNVVISSEVFFSLTENHIRRFSKILSGHDVRIICYLRRQDEFLHSFYMQCIKHPVMRLSEGPEQHDGFNEVVSIGRYDEIVGWWANAFGDNSMVVETYDKTSQKNGVIANFLEKLDLNIEPPDSGEARVNATIRTELIEYLRVANSLGVSSDQNQDLLGNLNRLSNKCGHHFTNYKYLSPQECKKVRDLYDDINEAVRAKWFTHRERLFDVDHEVESGAVSQKPELRTETIARISAWLWLSSQSNEN